MSKGKNTLRAVTQVPADQEAIHKAVFDAKLAQDAKESEECNQSADEIGTVVRRLSDRLDKFFVEAAFQFSSNLDQSSGKWTRGPFLGEFVEQFQPRTKAIYERLADVLDEIADPTRLERYDLSADLLHLIDLNRDTAYTIGVLTGARMSGMSSEKVKDLAGFLEEGWF